ncbi:MAG TPA: DUF5518 domain-containing protein [Methanobacterium sp.]
MFDWKAIGMGFVVTLVLAIIGLFVPFLGLLAPIIGGIVVGYMIGGGKYVDAIVDGGLSAGIAGFIFTLITVLLLGAAISTAAITAGYTGSTGALTAVAAIIGAIVAFIIFLILGLIGGIVGVAIKGQPKEAMAEPATEPEPIAEPETARMSPDIAFNVENVQKCLCPTCPVQAESDCAKEKLIKLQEMMQSEEEMNPTPEDVPGVYCSTGNATCTDIDPSKECQCPKCPMWEEYDLENGEPAGVFCRDGKAM